MFSGSCTSGNVAVIFAVAVVPLMLAVGAGVDMVRMNQAQTQLQAVADAAALSGGASPHTSEAQLQQIAINYLDANGADRNFTGVTVRNIKNNKAGQASSVSRSRASSRRVSWRLPGFRPSPSGPFPR